MANNNNEIMTFQNKENLKQLITDAENRFDKKYMTPNQFWSGYQQLIGAPHIEEVQPDDDDFGDSNKGVVSTTAGSDNFHAEGDTINEDAYVDTNDMLQLTDFPLNDSRFEQESPYFSGLKNPLLAKPQFRAPKVVPAIRPTVYNNNVDGDDVSFDANESFGSNDLLNIEKSIFDIDTDSDDDSLKTENVRIVEPKPKQEPEPVKQPDVLVEDVEVEEEPPMKPAAKEAAIEDMDDDVDTELLKEYKKNVVTLSAAKQIHAHSLLKSAGINNDQGWSNANYNKRKTIISKMFKNWDAQKKK